MARLSRFSERTVREVVNVKGAFDVSMGSSKTENGDNIALFFESLIPQHDGATAYSAKVTLVIENPNCLRELQRMLNGMFSPNDAPPA